MSRVTNIYLRCIIRYGYDEIVDVIPSNSYIIYRSDKIRVSYRYSIGISVEHAY